MFAATETTGRSRYDLSPIGSSLAVLADARRPREVWRVEERALHLAHDAIDDAAWSQDCPSDPQDRGDGGWNL